MCSEKATKHSLTHITGLQIKADLSLSQWAGWRDIQHIFKTSKCPIWDSMLIFNTYMHYSIPDNFPVPRDLVNVHEYYCHEQVKAMQIPLEVFTSQTVDAEICGLSRFAFIAVRQKSQNVYVQKVNMFF